MHNYYDVIEIDTYLIFDTLQNFHFRECFILSKLKNYKKNTFFFSNELLILNKNIKKFYVLEGRMVD